MFLAVIGDNVRKLFPVDPAPVQNDYSFIVYIVVGILVLTLVVFLAKKIVKN